MALIRSLGVLVMLALASCAHDSHVRVTSLASQVAYSPALPTSAYSSSDPTTAEILLTDLAPAELDRGATLEGLTGTIVQVRMFLDPSPGDTPIASTAVNCSIREIVLAGGQVGVYSGGGFLLPRDRPGNTHLRGTIKDATLRLSARTPSFVDRLGPSRLDATLAPVRDEALARRIRARVEEIVRATPVIAAPTPGEPTDRR